MSATAPICPHPHPLCLGPCIHVSLLLALIRLGSVAGVDIIVTTLPGWGWGGGGR